MPGWPYTATEVLVKTWFRYRDYVGIAAATCFLVAAGCRMVRAQETAQKPAVTTSEKSKPSATPELPAQLDLLETRVRFEVDGSSRKEVHAVVKINNELGVRQFAHLNFNFNRSFEQIEIPLVRITHASGGTADILPSAITDQPNPAVVNAPAYQDVRVKSVRILGLAPGDTLEYRIITTVSHHPLAPDFWLDHSFDRSGVVSHELFEIDMPSSHATDTQGLDPLSMNAPIPAWHKPSLANIQIGAQTPEPSSEMVGVGDSARIVYRWQVSPANFSRAVGDPTPRSTDIDIVVSSFASWGSLDFSLVFRFFVTAPEYNRMAEKLYKLEAAAPGQDPSKTIYDFVSRKIRTVDLPLGSTGFRLRSPLETLSSGYGTPEDKVFLFASLSRPTFRPYYLVMLGASSEARTQLPDPSIFTHLIVKVPQRENTYYLDPSLEVAPFGVIPPDFRGKPGFTLYEGLSGSGEQWKPIPDALPFPSRQHVSVDATLAANGTLTAKVHYSLRGDNEMLLRVAFHQAPKDKWKEVAQLLALSDGFRGQITNITASDPYATHDPFTLEYEITTPKFVDWSKKPVRIPALLPQLGLPDPPAKSAAGTAAALIELGTPLDVETSLVLHLPPGTTARTPTGTAVERDYATFASHYGAKDSAITAARHLNFILREVAAARAADYNAFIRIVQNDQAQEFTIERTAVDTPKTKTAPSTPSLPPIP
jgi:hypothetical protein